MSVCDFCRRTVLESNKVWDYHHFDLVDFQAAAKSGCIFCARLADAAEDLKPWFDDANGTQSLYRWNMRESARMRDTTSFFSIIFRPVPGRKNGKVSSEDLPELHFDMFPEEDPGFIPGDTRLGAGTDSKESAKQMAEWLRKCVSSHPSCRRRHGSHDFIPTRVLDVGTGTNWPPRHVRVVETKDKGFMSTGEPYMTLSHCWGPDSKGKFVQLTNDNMKEFTTQGIPWETTSHGHGICSNANFAQALQITRQLGVRYIWIDSVCIIQNDKQDWDVESKLMHKVYRNSYCNLAAAVSNDHTGGLFRQRSLFDAAPTKDQRGSGGGGGGDGGGLFQKQRRTPAVTRYVPKGVQSQRFSGRSWRIFPSDFWDKNLLGCHLYTRGWVFQERMLSPRLLQFGRDQIFWECATESACEILPDGLPASLDTRAGTDRYWRQRLYGATVSNRPLLDTFEVSLEKFWGNAVRTYTACDLTNPRDKEAALWRIAKLVRDALGQEYACGLWSTQIEEQLAWRVVDPSTSSSCPGVPKKGFPTWSWTRLRGTIQVSPRIHDPPRFYRVVSHKGGDIKFQFERALWDRLEGEHENMGVKPAGTKSKCFQGQAAKKESPLARPNPDEPSVLRSEKIALRGHICAGTLRSASEGEGWEFAIGEPGHHRQVVFTAHPDVQPPKAEISCDFLLLAASRYFIDRWDRELRDRDGVEEEDIVDEENFGVGMLVKRNGNELSRIGAVSFREICKEDWNRFRRACGQDEKALRDDLDAGSGEELWLV